MAATATQRTNQELVEQARATVPGFADLPDEEILETLSEEAERRGTLSNFPELDEFRRTRRSAFSPSLTGEARRAVERGTRGLAATALGGAALGAESVGAENLSESLLEASGRQSEAAAEVPATIPSFRDVGNVREALQYGIGKAGEALPSVAESLAVGIGTGAAGAAATGGPGAIPGFFAGFMGKTAAKRLIRKKVFDQLEPNIKRQAREQLDGIAAGTLSLRSAAPEIRDVVMQETRSLVANRMVALPATFANSYSLNAGGIFADLATDEGIDDDVARNVSLTAGLPAGALDVVLPTIVVSRLFPGLSRQQARSYVGRMMEQPGVKGYFARTGRDVATQGPTEASTEALQEVVAMAARKYADPDWTASQEEIFDRMVNAGVAGGLGGGMTGPITAVGGGSRQPARPEFTDEESQAPVPEPPQPEVAPEPAPGQEVVTEEMDKLVLRNLKRRSRDGEQLSEEDSALMADLAIRWPDVAQQDPDEFPLGLPAPAETDPETIPIPGRTEADASTVRRGVQAARARAIGIDPSVAFQLDRDTGFDPMVAVEATRRKFEDAQFNVREERQARETEQPNQQARKRRTEEVAGVVEQAAEDTGTTESTPEAVRQEEQRNQTQEQTQETDPAETSGQPTAPIQFAFWWEMPGRGPVAFYNTTEQVGEHPPGDTLPAEQVEALGYALPATPEYNPEPTPSPPADPETGEGVPATPAIPIAEPRLRKPTPEELQGAEKLLPDESGEPKILRTDLVRDVASPVDVVRGARPNENVTASQTRNFAAFEFPDGHVEVRGVFEDNDGRVVAHGPAERRVGQRDIARESGVSVATVNRVLKGQKVKAENERLVRDAMQSLGYSDQPGRSRQTFREIMERPGAELIGYFQTADPPSEMFQSFANRDAFESSIADSRQNTKAKTGGLAATQAPSTTEKTSFDAMESHGRNAAEMQALEGPGNQHPDGEFQNEDYTNIPVDERESAPANAFFRFLGDDATIEIVEGFGGQSGLRQALQGNRDRAIDKLRAILDEVLSQEVIDRLNSFSDTQVRQVLNNLLTDLEMVAESETLFRMPRPQTYRLTRAEARQRFEGLLAYASRAGLNLQLHQVDSNQPQTFFTQEGGAYQPSNRTITLVMRDAMNPTEGDVINLLHEIAHDLYRTSPKWLKQTLHDMIRRIPLGEQAFYRDARADPRLRGDTLPETLLTEERLVEHLTMQGIDRATSQGIVARILRALKELYQRAALRIQVALRGDNDTSTRMANAWAATRIDQILSGDLESPASRFIDLIGGRHPTYGEVIRLKPTIDGDSIPDYYNPTSGRFEYSNAIPNTMENVRHNIMAVRASYQQQIMALDTRERREADTLFRQVPDVDYQPQADSRAEALRTEMNQRIEEQARIDIAAINSTLALYDHAVRILREQNPEADIDSILADAGWTDPRQLRAESFERATVAIGREPNFDPEAVTIENIADPSSREVAELTAYKSAQDLISKMSEKHAKAVETIRKNRLWIDNNHGAYLSLMENVANAQELDRQARREFNRQISGLRRNIEKQTTKSEDVGETTQILRDLLDLRSENIPVPRRFHQLLNKVITGDTPVMSLLQSLSGLGIDFATTGTKAIRARVIEAAQTNESLAPLIRGDRGTALLANLISFLRHNAHYRNAIEIQLANQADRLEIQRALNEILEQQTEERIDRIVDAHRTSRETLRSKTVLSFAELRKKYMARQRQLERAERRRDSSNALRRGAEEYRNRLEGTRTVGFESGMVDGETIIDPQNTGMTEAQAQDPNNRRTLRIGTQSATPNEQILATMQRQAAWLNQRKDDPERGGQAVLYNTIDRQHKKLGRIMVSREGTKADRSAMTHFIRDVGTIAQRSGTVAGRLVQNMWGNFQKILLRHESDDNRFGTQWEHHASELMGLLGMKEARTFERHIYNKAVHFANTSRGRSQAEFFEALRSMLRSDPVAAAAIDRPGAWDSLVAFLKRTGRDNARRNENRAREGLLIKDSQIERFNPLTGETENVYREAVNRGGFTVGRHLHQDFSDMVDSMVNQYAWPKTREENPFVNSQEKYDTDRDSLQAELQALFPVNVRESFLRPLVFNDSTVVFDRPRQPDGLDNVKADAGLLVEAYESANGDVLQFIENLHELHEGQEPMGEFVQKTLDRIYKYFDHARDIHLQNREEQSTGFHGINHANLDSRVREDLPSDWISYDKFGRHDNMFATAKMAAHAAFGRQLKDLKSLHKQIENDLADQAGRLTIEESNLIRERPNLRDNHKALRNAVRSKLEAQEKGLYDRLAAARKVIPRYKAAEMDERAFRILNPKKGGLTGDLGFMNELSQFLVYGLTSAPKSAFRNLQTGNDMILGLGGLSRTSIKAALAAWNFQGQSLFGSLMQAIGVNTGANIQHLQTLRRIGRYDPAIYTKLRQRLVDMGPDLSNYEGRTAGKAIQRLRIARDTLSNININMVGEDANFPAFRPFGLFPQSQLVSNFGASVATFKAFDDFALRAIKFFEENQSALNDPDFQFTAEDLGYGKSLWGMLDDSRTFEWMRRIGDIQGVPLETMAREAYDRRNLREDPHQTILPDHVYSRLSEHAVTEISLQAGPRSRPAWALHNDFGRISMRLLGWSFARMGQMGDQARTANGERNIRTVFNFAKSMMLGILPASLAYSLFFDKYDEEILKKAPNIRPIGPGQTLNNNVMSVIERTANMGTFGMPGELLNGFVNYADRGNARIFTFDERVVWANSLIQLQQGIGNFFNVGGFSNANYATVYRRIATALGAGGAIQGMQIINGVIAPDIPGFKQEAEVTRRINAKNLLLVAGRDIGLETRVGGGFARPTPATPHVTNMLLAAMSNDRVRFREAHRRAVRAAREDMGREDAEDHVRRSYQSRNPLRSVFRTISEQEYRRLLQRLPESSRRDVQEALRYYNTYGQSLDINPWLGSEDNDRSGGSETIRQPSRQSLENMRAMAFEEVDL